MHAHTGIRCEYGRVHIDLRSSSWPPFTFDIGTLRWTIMFAEKKSLDTQGQRRLAALLKTLKRRKENLSSLSKERRAFIAI